MGLRIPRMTGFGLFVLIGLSACSTLSPVSGLREGPPKTADRIGDVNADWQPFAGGESSALAYFTGKIGEPRLEFYALRIGLDSPDLRILVGAGDKGEEGGEAMVSGTYVSSFVRNNGLLAGINAVPFEPSSDREGEKRRLTGLAISEGRLIAKPVPRYAALVFYRRGEAAIVEQAELDFPNQPDPLGGIENAVGGFHAILRNGELTRRARERRKGPRTARSAAGLSGEGKTLYLLVIDGKRLGSPGATEAETALILKQLGAAEGINLDGGGSSALALRFPDGETRLVNTPVHQIIPGRERAVAVCLGIGTK
ncbi:MAG: phosphodiester glycosidase family protein [Treponema sp.]|nr:phosphodiester glycosidase family protein [Treponema sp.]